MAKKKELSPEERLEAALVPEEEWPYQVPENWCWIVLSSAVNLYNGDRGSNYPSKKDYVEKGIPFINAGAIVDGKLNSSEFNYITREKYDSLRAGKVEKKDILYCLRGSLGKISIVEFEEDAAISSSLCILRTTQCIETEYLFYLLNTKVIQDQQFMAENGSAQPNLSAASVMKYKIPLPPLPEQHRIVSRIESLFSKLDEAKEAAQAVVDGFEDRKAAILHKAFTGELTKEWREKRQIPIDSWVAERIEARFDVTGGLQKTPSRSPRDNPIPYITVANVFRNYIKFSEIRYFEVTKEELERLQLKNKDLLIVEGNGSGNEIGRCAMWHNELPVCIHQNHIIRARAKTDNTSPEFVLYYLNSPDGSAIVREKAVTTAGLYNLSVGKVKTIVLSFPCIKEQQEIVRRLDAYLEKDVQIKESASSVLDQIDTMKKSILARAFRGELGTNDSQDENAVELLKRVLSSG